MDGQLFEWHLGMFARRRSFVRRRACARMSGSAGELELVDQFVERVGVLGELMRGGGDLLR